MIIMNHHNYATVYNVVLIVLLYKIYFILRLISKSEPVNKSFDIVSNRIVLYRCLLVSLFKSQVEIDNSLILGISL